jgi:lipopolysaccharide/colanic/teichoic acid biosynthesis glycosyltransferase
MFRLEKIFQADDSVYINTAIFWKAFSVFLSIYIFSILEFNSIYDLINYNIYKSSKYFHLSLFFTASYLIFSFIFGTMKKRYYTSFLIFLINDIIPLVITFPFTLYLFFLLKIDFNLDINISYLFILIVCNLFIFRKISDFLYSILMNNNVIQRNIMLVGTVDSINKILKEKGDKKNIYKCCLIKNKDIISIEEARILLKIPVFTEETEVRLILEYHELGQIWILDNEEKNLVNYYLDLVFKFSVDIFIVNIKENLKNHSTLFPSDNLINNKYTFSNYQTSRFYGFNLFIKIFLDKVFSVIFLLILSPIFILAMLLILIEDGFPVFTSEESLGWDGRRFILHKLRIKKKKELDKLVKNQNSNTNILKIGKIISKFHIDEIPQFFNVLKDDMSIVGPRPHEFLEDLTYSKVFKKFLIRNKTSPGITGWAQINGYRGKNPTDEQIRKRMEYDLWYMNNWNIWLDLYIIFRSFFAILNKPNK